MGELLLKKVQCHHICSCLPWACPNPSLAEHLPFAAAPTLLRCFITRLFCIQGNWASCSRSHLKPFNLNQSWLSSVSWAHMTALHSCLGWHRYLSLPACLSFSGTVRWCRWGYRRGHGPCAACQKGMGTWRASRTWALISRKEEQKMTKSVYYIFSGSSASNIILVLYSRW